MRLLDLHLLAYGPFSDRRLDLSAGDRGLHLIFGRNEAGKSSALRALRALLFGIPERTTDDFLHANRDLRVGGRLRGSEGDELVCYRRKGRKKTLLGADDKPIDEDLLVQLLGGMDETRFTSQYGIDYEALVAGGQALLAERGREAEALFGSALGSAKLHRVLSELDEEAGGLFTPRGQKPAINAGLRRLTEIGRDLREASLKAGQWDEARRHLSGISGALADLDKDLIRASGERVALERVRRTLPGLARRRELRAALADLGAPPHLAEDFGQRRQAAVSDRGIALEARLKAKRRLEDLRREADGLSVSEDLLAEADAVDDLRERLGSYRKALRDRPGLISTAESKEADASRHLGELSAGLDLADLPRLRVLLGRRRRATELGARREAFEGAVKTTAIRLAETRARLESNRVGLRGMAEPRPLDDLRRAVEGARRVGNTDAVIAEIDQRLGRHEEACGRELATLGRWRGTLADLRAAALPTAETLRRFASDLDQLRERARELERTRDNAAVDLQRTREALRTLELSGEVPTEEALSEARGRRDLGWRLLRRQWVDGDEQVEQARAYGNGTVLPDAFENAISSADGIADRLRREAGRVHDQAAARAAFETCTRSRNEAHDGLEGLAEEQARWDTCWSAVWGPCGVTPLPPQEMLHWLNQALRLREKATELDELRAARDAQRARRDACLRGLGSALSALGDESPDAMANLGLAVALGRAEDRLSTLEDVLRERDLRRKEIAAIADTESGLAIELKKVSTGLADWRSSWNALTREIGLGGQAGPGDVSDYLETIATAAGLAEAAAGLHRRIEAIDADAEAFRDTAGRLLARLSGDLVDRPVEEAVPRLHARVGEQREAKSRRTQILSEARRAEKELGEAEARIQAANLVLFELRDQAGCGDLDELEAVEHRDAEHRRLTGEVQEIERGLLAGGDGLGIGDLEVQAEAYFGQAERDGLPERIVALNERIERELRPRREGLIERKVNAERDFNAMSGGDTAARLGEEAERMRARLRRLAERYLRVKLAGRVLREEIERFRQEHRDPILARAGGYFTRITQGSFALVATDFDESDQPVLVGVRANGERLRVESMSTGTRDQLYLALRLATLDHDLELSEPLPFIVDDILIQFDDERARATLDALAELSSKTQVILFTHHRRDLEQAARIDGKDARVFVHELG